MYTHIYVTPDDAERLYDLLSDSSLTTRGFSYSRKSTFQDHFIGQMTARLPALEMTVQAVRDGQIFKLVYKDYLPKMPDGIIDLGITPVKAEIVRMANAPTRARAGYYANESLGLVATVENVFPASENLHGDHRLVAQAHHDTNKRTTTLRYYAQNIRVSGPTLEAAQEFNSSLSQGFFNRFLVHPFE